MIDNLGSVFLERIRQLREENGGRIEVKDVEGLVEKFMELIKGFISNHSDVKLYNEISKIKDRLTMVRNEIETLRPKRMYEKDIPGATAELSEITKATEKATNTILDSAEQIQNVAGKLENQEATAQIFDLTTKIFEACNFQDLTSQRITKVLKVFDEFDKLVNTLIDNLSLTTSGDDEIIDKTDPKILLNGPQLEKDAPTQSQIDEMFNNKNNNS